MLVLLTVLAIISGIAWLFGFFVYHVASASIHLLLLLAVAFGALALVMRVRYHRVA